MNCFMNYQYAHKAVLIAAITTSVTISSRFGERLCSWPRAKYKGQWQTDPEHLPANYRGTLEWNGPYFKQKTAAIGPYTEEVITKVLDSRKYEVQTYRQYVGILGFAKRYSRPVLETGCYYREDNAHFYQKRDSRYRNGMPLALVSEWLGHSKIDTTRRYYANADTAMKKEAIEKATSAFNPLITSNGLNGKMMTNF